MLKLRIMTAAALLPLAWLLIFKLQPEQFALAAAALMLLVSWEFRKLAGIDKSLSGWLLLAVQCLIFWLLGRYWAEWSANPSSLFGIACLAWAGLFLQMYFYKPGSGPGTGFQVRGFFNALTATSFAWMALTWLRYEPDGQWWILILLLSIWSADIGAYFAGRAFGKKKMSPGISPGKTWAGLVGGLLAAGIFPVIAAMLIPQLNAPVIPLAIVCVITAAASAGGDLFISMHKRIVGCKDTGRILPGHGGILDRLDSLLAGAPFFALGKVLAGM